MFTPDWAWPPPDWLAALDGALARGESVVLVTLATAEGSTPREAGARMLVGKEGVAGSVGGGALEWEAIATARRRLAADVPAVGWTEVALGPALDQCCGGRARVTFERLTPADRSFVRSLLAHPRPVLLRAEVVRAGPLAWSVEAPPRAGADAGESDKSFRAGLSAGGSLVLHERLGVARRPVLLFGAGHVGRAVATALAPLPFAVTWIDSRPGAFPRDLPTAVRSQTLALPEQAIAGAPGGSAVLVMTHSHALDLVLCDAALGRTDLAYVGLIGSATKRATFLNRLAEAGHGPEARARLVCPIGLPGLGGKEPAVVAASVAADLLVRLRPKGRPTGGDHV